MNIDLCQQCFADKFGDSLTIAEPDDDNKNDEQVLEYHNIFEAITQSKEQENHLKNESDLRIAARDILLAKKITNQSELTAALKRVEQLWDVQYHSAEGNELHQLADLICNFEGNSWDIYFNKVDAASDDFMAEREDIMEQKAVAKRILSGTKVNNDDDKSMESSVDE